MFTGIVETTGTVVGVEVTEDGRRLRIVADLDPATLAEGQSISVSGACLTVETYGRLDGDAASAAGDALRTHGGGPELDLDVDVDRDSEVDLDSGATPGSASDAPAGRDGPADGGGPAWFEVFLAAETVERTYLDELDVGDEVNVERALKAEDRLDGHFVQGHVDATAAVEAVRAVGEDWEFEFSIPEGRAPYVVEKGSIAVDGISLTVADVDPDAGRFSVAIVPTTYEVTTLSEKSVGDPVHLEFDVLAKYVESIVGDR